MDRITLIRLVQQDAKLGSEHQAENVVNAVFAHFKTMLTPDEIDAIAARIDAEDLRDVWLTASLPTRRPEM